MTILTNVIERTPLLDAALAVLASLDARVYLGEAGAKPDGTTESVPKVARDPLSRVAPYVVLMPWVGNPTAEQSVAGDQVDLDWGFDLTVASGFVRDTLAVAAEADSLLYRHRLVPDETFPYVVGRLVAPPGYAPGLITDRDENPHRYYVPMQYGTTITST